MEQRFIRVIEIPPSSGNFHFGGSEVQPFKEIDWFQDTQDMLETPDGRVEIANFIKAKQYFDPSKAYLVLCKDYTFTINYNGE